MPRIEHFTDDEKNMLKKKLRKGAKLSFYIFTQSPVSDYLLALSILSVSVLDLTA